MTWGLGANPIISLSGGHFLLFYYTIIITSRYFLILYKKNLHKKQFKSLNVNEDPFFIAWLKDSTMGIINMVMGSLLDGSYITKKNNQHYQSTKKKKADTTIYERLILDYFRKPNTVSGISKIFMNEYEGHQEKAESMHLVYSNTEKHKIVKRHRLCLLSLMALGLYKLIIAVNTGHANIGFLTLTIFVVVPVVFASRINMNEVTLTPCGQEYIRLYHDTLLNVKNKNLQQVWLSKVLTGSAAIAGLYATQAAASDYDNSSFTHDISDSSGSSCGGSSCSGSSCGGSGCGGCGGD
ncbi:TIGR04222 domain-containing membrane protein [Citrobacter freundii]|uniref:TIGR04222 domain-containing membrane protein n=1 Tax=Citrobacter freundii TaxID=546 RepID=A0AAE7KX52_CITFR|nr:TIGR04222 domain-containing membrane protein [Citrobacter freundii]QLO12353.1 TIGR04222 domain-containing membrane protein [Citrobacter freundii]